VADTLIEAIFTGGKKMKTFAYLLLVGSVLVMTAPAFAENRAVNIAIGSIGGAVDNAALQTVRQVIGYAVARGTVDTFIVLNKVAIEPILSACAEAGFYTQRQEFTAFVQQLRSIRPQLGTFYNVQPTAHCLRDTDVFCTDDVQACPDGSFVGRVPPSCKFAACPGDGS
jgi:hypothetical protein